METTEQTQDFGQVQKRLKFSKPFLDGVAKAPYLDPGLLVVAGDESTEEGRKLAGTYLDDGRANLPWGPEHEKILIGLLTGSSLVKITESVEAPDGGLVKRHLEVAVSDGQPVLVYLQGHDEEWFPVAHDGRQRRRAALELNRRLRWIAGIVDGVADGRIRKPARRNALVKIGHAAAKGREWADIVADDKIGLSKVVLDLDIAAYSSPEVGGSLAWLTDTFVNHVVGSEDLGEQGKKGWLHVEKDADGNPVAVRSYDAWLKIFVAGTNIDPKDPFILLGNVAAKEAQVQTPPSLLAEQIDRIVSARMNPDDPNSEPLYDQAAVLEKFGMSPSTLENYQLVRGLCDEVVKLVDSREMSLNFAVGDRLSAFVTWPKGQKRSALPFDKQRLILQLLADELGDEPNRFRGPAALKAAAKIRDGVLSGKLGAATSEAETDNAEAPRPSTKPAKPKAAPSKKRRVDLAAFREKASAAYVEAQKKFDEGDETAVATIGQLDLARALASVISGAADTSILSPWPAVRAAFEAATPRDEADEQDLIHDWIAAATEEMTTKGTDKPTVTADTDSHGRKPSPEQVERCNALIAQWIGSFQNDPTATMLDEYILAKIASAPAQPAA